MIPMMLQQGYKALATTFDVWGVANMVKDGMTEARAVIEKAVAETAQENGAAEANGAKEANGTAEVPVRQ
jgi:4-hydroxy-2-oxoheptanedioate aldolase